jgi:hypothetical protein
MKNLRAVVVLFLAIAVCLAALGCQVPGVVRFAKNNGKWEAVAVDISQNDITPGVIVSLENRLNAVK